jgi:hypothetical protein
MQLILYVLFVSVRQHPSTHFTRYFPFFERNMQNYKNRCGYCVFFACDRFNVFVRRVYVSKCFECCFRLLENPRRVLGEAIDMSNRPKSLSILKFFSPCHFSSVDLVWQLDVINMRQQAKRGRGFFFFRMLIPSPSGGDFTCGLYFHATVWKYGVIG